MIRVLIIAFISLSLASLSSCSKKKVSVSSRIENSISKEALKPAEISGWIMEMPYHVLIGDPLSDTEKKSLKTSILAIFSDINDTFNKFNPNSELSRLNRLKAYEKVAISKPLANMLLFCKEMYRLSEGRFDPTVEKAMQLWKASLEKGAFLDEVDLHEAKASIGLDKVHVEEGIFYKTADNLALDLGGIAKGHAIDLIADKLRAKGITSALINWSGELYAFGKHPEKRAWQVMIPAYVKKGVKLPLENQALATSGDYLQNLSVAVKDKIMTFCHILDPRSAWPLQIKPKSIACVSVAAKSCMLADALATSAMIFQDSKKLELWIHKVKVAYPETSFWTLQREGGFL